MTLQVPSISSTTAGANISLLQSDGLYIGRGIQIASTDGTAVLSPPTGLNDMVLEGTASGDRGVGLGPSSSLLISSTGIVYGDRIGVYGVGGSGATFLNEGLILAGGLAVYDRSTQDLQVINRGTIRSGLGDYLGQNRTIQFEVIGTKTIVNSGVIEALKGGSPAIASFHVASVELVTNSGTIRGDVFLGGGDDRFDGRNGRLFDVLSGEGGADTLLGGVTADRINGGDGSDTISGGLGKDVLTGGPDNDSFQFAAKTHSRPGSGADIITDFDRPGMGNDRIDVSGLFGPKMQYIHAAAFTKAGQVRINDVVGPDVIVEVNTGGSLAADFAIRLSKTALSSMSAGDFIL
jgi:Ca2+-binding RTX toxin-like protein